MKLKPKFRKLENDFITMQFCQHQGLSGKKYLHFWTYCKIFQQNSHCGGDPSVIEHIEPLIFGDVAIVVFVCCQEIFSQLKDNQILKIQFIIRVRIPPLIFFLVPPFVRLLPSSLVYTFLYFYFADV